VAKASKAKVAKVAKVVVVVVARETLGWKVILVLQGLQGLRACRVRRDCRGRRRPLVVVVPRPLAGVNLWKSMSPLVLWLLLVGGLLQEEALLARPYSPTCNHHR